ncbi:hypothetical protein BJX76DRAFT_139395 [Aspergillus varians]
MGDGCDGKMRRWEGEVGKVSGEVFVRVSVFVSFFFPSLFFCSFAFFPNKSNHGLASFLSFSLSFFLSLFLGYCHTESVSLSREVSLRSAGIQVLLIRDYEM